MIAVRSSSLVFYIFENKTRNEHQQVRVSNLGKTVDGMLDREFTDISWMTVTENVHVPLWGLHAYTSSVDVEGKSANLHVDVDIQEQLGLQVLKVCEQNEFVRK